MRILFRVTAAMPASGRPIFASHSTTPRPQGALVATSGYEYAHVIPGMQAEAAELVAALVANSRPTNG